MARQLLDYLISLPEMQLTPLYDEIWVTHSVFRSLPPLAKSYVIRMVYLTTPLNGIVLDKWTTPEGRAAHLAAFDKLRNLRVLQDVAGHGEKVLVQLNPAFQQQLQRALSGKAWKPWNADPEQEDGAPSVEQLDEYAEAQWENVLHFMISTPGRDAPSNMMIDLLEAAQLMQQEGADSLRVTPAGFRFLLWDAYSQIWLLLVRYINQSEARGLALADVLSFLLQLGFLSLGSGYPAAVMATESQRALLEDMREFGLIYRDPDSALFYPTRFAIYLMSEGEPRRQASGQDTEAFIIVETNFRLYAYTKSQLKIGLVSLFTQLKYRLPNLAVCMITRDSVKAALKHGIGPEEIIRYLVDHAHPEMRVPGRPLIHETVTDQIRLWDMERKRVVPQAAVLCDFGGSASKARQMGEFAQSIGALLWADYPSGRIAVSADGYERVKRFKRESGT